MNTCPFHLVFVCAAACLDLHDTPEGAWHCPNCNKLGHGGNFARPIVIRLTRVVKTPEYDVGGCAVCRLNLLKFLIDFTLANSRKSFFLGKELDASIKLANDLFVTLTIIYIIKDVIFLTFASWSL
jgi:hypothetical protein